MYKVQRLPFREKVGYSLGDMAFNFTFMPVTVFILYFYTDVFGISAASAATLIMVARLWDAINDPIIGAFVDKTQSRWGKFRPYILFSAIPLAIMLVLTFTTPNLSQTGKLIYAYITYIGLGMVSTVYIIPYGALTSSMTQDHAERANLSAIRIIFAMIGGAIVVAGVPILTQSLAGGNLQLGYQYTMSIFAVIAVVLMIISFKTTKERYSVKSSGKTTVKGMLNLLKTNKPLQILCVAFFVFFGISGVSSVMGMYYFTYVLNRTDLLALAGTIPMGFMLISLFFVPFLLKHMEKKTVLMIGSFITIIRFLVIFTGSVPIILIGMAIGGIGSGLVGGVIWGFVPDTIEYGEWKTGIRAEGIVYAIVGFFYKFGSALGGLVPGVVLTMTGYVPNVAQTKTALFGIISLMSVIPLVLTIAYIVIMRFYTLDKETYNNILEELKTRKAVEGESVA